MRSSTTASRWVPGRDTFEQTVLQRSGHELSESEGVDVILDPVGAGYLSDNLDSLRLGGRLVLIGLMSGAKTELDMGKLMMKRLRVIGSTLRARPLVEKKP